MSLLDEALVKQGVVGLDPYVGIDMLGSAVAAGRLTATGTSMCWPSGSGSALSSAVTAWMVMRGSKVR